MHLFSDLQIIAMPEVYDVVNFCFRTSAVFKPFYTFYTCKKLISEYIGDKNVSVKINHLVVKVNAIV